MVFYFLDASAKSVALVGDFNRWDPSHTPFERMANGVWKATIPAGISSVFRYKFLVDDERWIEDPNNWLKEDDGVGGLSSVLLLG
jgi:1,4-alpha-glucan branching enzyme